MCVSSVWNRVYLRCSCALSCPFSKPTWGILLFPERSSHLSLIPHQQWAKKALYNPWLITGAWGFQNFEMFVPSDVRNFNCLQQCGDWCASPCSHSGRQNERSLYSQVPNCHPKVSLTWGVTQPHLTYFGLSCPGAEGCTCIELLFSWQGRVDPPCLVSRQLHSLRGVAPLPGSHGEARLSDIIRAFLTWINRLKSPGRSTADYWLLCDWQSHLGIYTTTSRLHHLSKPKCSFPNLACCYFHLLENLSVVPRAGEIWQRSTLPFLMMVGKTCNSKVKLKEVLILVQGSWYSPGRNMLCPVPKSLSNITYDI